MCSSRVYVPVYVYISVCEGQRSLPGIFLTLLLAHAPLIFETELLSERGACSLEKLANHLTPGLSLPHPNFTSARVIDMHDHTQIIYIGPGDQNLEQHASTSGTLLVSFQSYISHSLTFYPFLHEGSLLSLLYTRQPLVFSIKIRAHPDIERLGLQQNKPSQKKKQIGEQEGLGLSVHGHSSNEALSHWLVNFLELYFSHKSLVVL